MFRDLALGRIDAELSSSLISQESFLSKPEGADYGFLGGDLLDVDCYGEGVGIAVRKGDDALRDAMSAGIVAIREDGTYKAINDPRVFSVRHLRRPSGWQLRSDAGAAGAAPVSPERGQGDGSDL